MQSTRQRILDYLDQHGAASPRQLARAFGMTPANVRRHLGILEQRDLVLPGGLRPSEGRGRPERVYTLSSAAQGDGLQALASALLQSIEGRQQGAVLQKAAKQLAGEDPRPGGQTQRLVAAMQRLAPLSYRPRWEARPDGPQIVLGQCPFAAIIAEHPELCRLDAELLQELLGAGVEQTAKLEAGPDGLPQCIFRVKASAN